MLDANTEQSKRATTKVTRPMIDLFAGCGGLSLGFESAGFTPVFVNELNDDARATYLRNRDHMVGAERFNERQELSTADINSITLDRIGRLQSDLSTLDSSLQFGAEGTIDVLAGGPPCQGFSGIGHRRSYSVDKCDLPSNQLYERMAFVIERVRPRIFLFENVRGLLFSRWTSEGRKGEIWNDVYGRFKRLGEEFGYDVRWQLVHASDYGVPQNRPRVLMVGIRKDVASLAGKVIDLSADQHSAYACGFLPRSGTRRVPDLIDLLSDLEDEHVVAMLEGQDFPHPFEAVKYPNEAKTEIQLRLRPGALAAKGARLTEQEYSRHAERIVAKFKAMIESGGVIPEEFRTKKFSQKLLPPRWGNKPPSITATSMPDDYVHYREPRILTVREWARLQTFPDWYQFEGKRTTGGLRRAGNPREGLHDREVPKYTQIGNAVPVRLAEAVAVHFGIILTEAGYPAVQ